MDDFFLLMWKPLLACFILTGIHAYLGLHVVEREVIFVDLALAQIAALGATFVILLGQELHSPLTYWFSLTATFIGAVVLSLTRTRKKIIPQEAIIGIVYVVAAASCVMFLSRTPEGDEGLRHMISGNILLVSMPEIIRMAVLYSTVGAIHWLFRKKFILISTDPEEAFKQGISIKKWDLLFYLTFGLVVTSSVQTAGVLLVFSYLIMPAVGAMLFSRRLSVRLVLGWGIGALVSFLGLLLSYHFDFPTGSSIIVTFGMVLTLLVGLRFFVNKGVSE